MIKIIDDFSEKLYIFKNKHKKSIMVIIVFVIIPIATGLSLGYEMCYDVASGIPTVIVDHDNTEFSRTFSGYVKEHNYFDVIEEASNDQRIEEMFFKGQAHVGIIIPEGFYDDMKEGRAANVLTVYDGSTMSVITNSKSAMTEMILTIKAGYMMKIYEGKLSVVPAEIMNHVMPIDVTYRVLYNPTRNFRNFLLPGLLGAVIQVGIAVMGAERAGEVRKTGLPFSKHINKIAIWSVFSTLSITICLLIQYLFFNMPYKGTLVGGIILTYLFSLCIFAMGYVIGTAIEDRTLATQISSVLVLPTAILGGYTWPVLAMPVFFQKLAMFIPFSYYGEALRNLCLKDMEIRHISKDIRFMILFFAVEIILLFLLKRKEAKLEY